MRMSARSCKSLFRLTCAVALAQSLALDEVRIGVLAKRGAQKAIDQWGPTFSDFLNDRHSKERNGKVVHLFSFLD